METRHSPPERGASSAEYALVLAGIAAVIVAAVFSLGPVTGAMFDDTCQEFAAQVSSSC